MSEFKKYPKIYRLGNEETKDFFNFTNDSVVIEEKVDGGCGVFWVDYNRGQNKDGELHVGSRNRDLTQEKDEKTFAKQRAALIKTLRNKKLNPDYYYYIEWMAPHTIRYESAPEVIGLDIRLKRSMDKKDAGLFLGRDTREQLFNELEIENVPIVWRGKISELKNIKIEKLIPKSKYYDGKAEGIVLKNYNRKAVYGNHQLYAKVVADEFKENNKAVFGGIRQKSSDTEKMVEEFCTTPRIEKHIKKLINEENKPLEMGLMRDLPRNVMIDILEEEIINFSSMYNWLNFKQMKELVIKRCVGTLKMVIEDDDKR